MVHSHRILQLLTITLIIIGVSSSLGVIKRGLALPQYNYANGFNLFKNSTQINWVYNGGSDIIVGTPFNFEPIAMQKTKQNIETLHVSMIYNQAKVLLGFNEPENSRQANLSVSEAIQLWKEYILPVANSKAHPLRLGSPATSNSPEGLSWLKEFMKECDECQIDFIACHWYGNTLTEFTTYLQTIHKAFPNNKIWVTAFALKGNQLASRQKDFFDQASSYLEKTSFIERYSWDGPFQSNLGNALVDPKGHLTDLGLDYISRVNSAGNMGGVESTEVISDASDDSNFGYDAFLGLY